MAFIRRNIEEIAGDPALRAFGALLGLTHVLTFLLWVTQQDLVSILAVRPPICWPFFAECYRHRPFSPASVRWMLGAYLVASVASIALFVRRSTTALAWWASIATFLATLAIVAQDFELRLNQHVMSCFAIVAFLFVRRKRAALEILVVLFYVWAGLLKLGPEWLSGAALYRPVWFFTGALLPIATTFVVVLETILVWGLLTRPRWSFYPTLGLFIAFHIFSWPVVGFYYPSLMFCLLAIYPLDRFFPRDEWRTRPSPDAYALAAIFSAAQMFPRVLPGDSALTGEGRIFSVHMFDALVRCDAHAVLKRIDGGVEDIDLYRPLSPRIRCDPIVYWNDARALCRSGDHGARFRDLDLFLSSRRSTSPVASTVILVHDFCEKNPDYRLLGHNAWIEAAR